jgi:hypothetical protein
MLDIRHRAVHQQCLLLIPSVVQHSVTAGENLPRAEVPEQGDLSGTGMHCLIEITIVATKHEAVALIEPADSRVIGVGFEADSCERQFSGPFELRARGR